MQWATCRAFSLHVMCSSCVLQVATYRAFTLWREADKLSDKDKKECMFQQTFMIQELCEKGNLQKQRPEAKAQMGKDYLRCDLLPFS